METHVKVLATINAIVSALFALVGAGAFFFMMLMGFSHASLGTRSTPDPDWVQNLWLLLTVGFLVMLLVEGGWFISSIALWRRRPWARKATLTFVVIHSIAPLLGLLTGRIEEMTGASLLYISLLVYSLVVLLSAKCKALFAAPSLPSSHMSNEG